MTLLQELVKLKRFASDKLVSSMNLNGYEFRNGVCENIRGENYLRLRAAIREVVKDWEHYSGHNNFPVTHPDHLSSCDGYFLSYSKWLGEYGRRRRELLDLLISYAKEYNL